MNPRCGLGCVQHCWLAFSPLSDAQGEPNMIAKSIPRMCVAAVQVKRVDVSRQAWQPNQESLRDALRSKALRGGLLQIAWWPHGFMAGPSHFASFRISLSLASRSFGPARRQQIWPLLLGGHHAGATFSLKWLDLQRHKCPDTNGCYRRLPMSTMCGMKGLRFEHTCLVMSDSQLEFKMIWRNGSERESSHRRHEPRVAVPEVVIIAGLHRGKVKKSLLPLDSIDVNCCIVVMCRKYLLSWLHYR